MGRATILAVSLGLTWVVIRASLHLWPNTDLIIAGYGIHHLFTGVILVTVGGIAGVVLPHQHRWSRLSIAVFGVGLALALDEWPI